MTHYEKLLDDANKHHVIVTENFDLSDTRLNMDNPQQITKEEAESMGLTPCKKCY